MQVRKMKIVFGIMTILAVATTTIAQPQTTDNNKNNDNLKGDPYTLKTCPVSGDELGDETIVKEYDGREVRFCCTDCIPMFEKKPDKYWEKINAMQIKQQLPWYPMTACVVSGKTLQHTEMGDPVNYIYKNRLVRFCCGGCIKKFEKNPTAYLAKLDEQVIAQQKDKYPLKECLITGKPLVETSMGAPIDMVISNRLVRFCCAGCPKKFKKDPVGYFAKIDKAYGENLPSLKNVEAEIEPDQHADHDGHQHDNHEHGG